MANRGHRLQKNRWRHRIVVIVDTPGNDISHLQLISQQSFFLGGGGGEEGRGRKGAGREAVEEKKNSWGGRIMRIFWYLWEAFSKEVKKVESGKKESMKTSEKCNNLVMKDHHLGLI